jgi:site-specific DNA recombinase
LGHFRSASARSEVLALGLLRDSFGHRSWRKQRPPEPAPLTHLRFLRSRLAARKKRRGCIYARFSTRFQASIEDQVRSCREWAERNNVEIDDVHVYSDAAKTGKARRRKGLQSMLAALDRGEIDVVITFATNRLNRKIHLALQFVEGEIVEKRRRCVFVAQNIDTANTQFWKQLLYVFAMLDEFQVQMSAAHIRAAHIGLLLKRWVHSTLTFGYTGVPIPGDLTRQGKPRRRWEVDEEAKKWVVKAFHWYVHEREGFSDIARRLRKAGAPPPPKVSRWTGKAVRYLLMNRRYVGDWSYGWKETVWQSEADYGRQFQKDKPTHEHREEHLRLIDDGLFYRAQELTAKKLGKGGRPTHRGLRLRDPVVEVLWCHEHDRHVSPRGQNSGQLACPQCKAEADEKQHLFSLINRALARKLLCQELVRRIHADAGIVDMAVESARRQVEAMQQPDEGQLAAREKELSSLNGRIAFVLDNPGETETDREENAKQLGRLRAERAKVQRQIAEVNAVAARRRDVPTAAEIRCLMREMEQILLNAVTSDDEEELGKAMGIIVDLTGGKVVLSQQGEAKAKRGWLRGTFRLRLLDTLLSHAGCGESSESDVDGEEVVIDFREETDAEQLADRAKELYDQGRLVKKIATELGVSRNLVAAALTHWFTSRGLEVPDGRTRRSHLKEQHLLAPPYQRIADEVKRRCDAKQLLQDIAKELGCDRNTVTQAHQFWYNSRGLEPPDGRTRRKELAVKAPTPQPR